MDHKKARVYFPAEFEEEDMRLPHTSTEVTSFGTRQTCLSSAKKGIKAVSKRVEKRNDFFRAQDKEKKLPPVQRPQNIPENKDFYVDAVKRNLGLSTEIKRGVSSIDAGKLVKLNTVTEMGPCDRRPAWISNPVLMEEFEKQLLNCSEVAVDFEFNIEHSYEGMTALIQMTTFETDVIIDPPPIYGHVKKLLQDLMTTDRVLKIFCGGANDFIHLRKEFLLESSFCLDIQILDKRIRGVPPNSESRGLKTLCNSYLKIDLPKGETNRDWRRRPLPTEMLTYAQNDSYYAMAIFQQMKKLIFKNKQDNLLSLAIQDTSALITKLMKSVNAKVDGIVECPINLRGIILKWRETAAKLHDEKPQNVLPDKTVTKLVANPPQTLRELEAVIGNSKNVLKKGIHGLHRILVEKKDFFSDTECHKCGVKGHPAAWCNQKTNRELQKEYFQRHPEAKAHQNRRRNLNKKINKQKSKACNK